MQGAGQYQYRARDIGRGVEVYSTVSLDKSAAFKYHSVVLQHPNYRLPYTERQPFVKPAKPGTPLWRAPRASTQHITFGVFFRIDQRVQGWLGRKDALYG